MWGASYRSVCGCQWLVAHDPSQCPDFHSMRSLIAPILNTAAGNVVSHTAVDQAFTEAQPFSVYSSLSMCVCVCVLKILQIFRESSSF